MSRASILRIIKEVATRAGYTLEELIKDDRTKHITKVRHYAIWRAQKETGSSFCEIGRMIDRDYSTISDAVNKVEALPPEVRGVFVPRPIARKKIVKTYIGKPCRNGHNGLRYDSNDRCVMCQREKHQRSYWSKKQEAAE